MRCHHFNQAIALLLCALLPLFNTAAAEPSPPESFTPKTQFVIGKVTQNAKKHRQRLQPMADYLAEHMNDLGIDSGTVLTAESNQEMIGYLREGKVDFIAETPFSAMIYTQSAPAEAIVRMWKRGIPSYYSIIFTRKDGGINRLQDLQGNTIAFEDPGSTSAYMLPMATLLQQGYSLVRKDSNNLSVPENMICYLFSHSEQNTSSLVYNGKVEAGAISNLDWDKPDHLPLRHKRKYQIIHRSKPVPRAIGLVRSNLPLAVRERVKQLLLNADNDPAAARALKKFHHTKRFDELDEETLAVLEQIKKLTPFFSPLEIPAASVSNP